METPERVCKPPIVACTITIENLTEQGTIKKSTALKGAKISLVRNEFRDMLLLVEAKNKLLKYPLMDFKILKRFLKEGKATILLQDRKINLMISNAPPNSLFVLLKSIYAKNAVDSQKSRVPMRERLLSNLPQNIEEISPIVRKEAFYDSNKRKLSGEGKENIPGSSPLSSKKPRIDANSKSPKVRVQRPISSLALSKEQRNVLTAVIKGHNVFFTGGAGTGKSYLLKKIIGALPPELTFVTASTGIAACQIGGTTLHSFAGVGSGETSLEKCIQLASRSFIAQQWKKCKCLIIDEISMVDGTFFEKLETVARTIRRNDKPFGGIQLVLCGDFFQLPPVTKKGAKKRFCFQTSAWFRCITINMMLNQVKRQDDPKFVKLLDAIRFGRCSKEEESRLKETSSNIVERDGIKATRLCTHKDDVESINNVKLNELTSPAHTFLSVDSDTYHTDLLNSQIPVCNKLTLKVGAQVMLMKNLDVSKGLVNGARGVVTSFKAGSEGNPVVKFACGITTEIKPEKWTVKITGGVMATRYQIPLKLGWAFSIHKSQGMTLDCVEMSLSKVFEPGQAYVALSRARDLDCIRVLDFSQSCIKAHPDVISFYHNLQINSG